jgi:simple sugar transport system ATP-binding protein
MAEQNNDLVTMEGIRKTFPGVQALEDVSFSLRRGEIHALVGENGAGKSTLIKVLTGVERQDAGMILLEGKHTAIHSPQHALDLGISTVYQEVNLCPNLTVAENIMIGREPRRLGPVRSAARTGSGLVRRLGGVDWKAMNERADRILRGLDVCIDVTQPLGSYSVAIQQMAAIARALEIASAKILILDEPTSSLDSHETQQLFSVMRKLRGEGMGVVFITHFLDQVFEVADRITVLRNGRLVGTFETQALTRLELIARMLGRNLVDFDDMTRIKLESAKNISGEALLQASHVGHSGSIEPFDLDLHAGEVVGLAGLLGSGRTEIAELLFGSLKPDQGSIWMHGKRVKQFSPLASIKRGVALCPEDRKFEGIVDELTIRENIILAMQASQGSFRYINKQKQYDITNRYIQLLNIATPSADQPVKNLSGGNQQKVILARWLAIDPEVLILDEPTRGIDVGAKAEIQKLVLDLAEEGKSCVFISSELEEVLRTSHRIVVLRDREKVTEFSGEVDEHQIMQTMAGSG